MGNWVIKEDVDGGRLIGLLARPFVSTWLFMLVIGALAHQFHFLPLAIGYWQCFLVLLASRMLQRSHIDRWKIGIE